MGKVKADTTYEVAVEVIKAGITSQTNQAMSHFKLFTGMSQESQPFSTWWTKVKEQADKCMFEAYNAEKAARDALLFQTSDVRLGKKVLAEDSSLADTVKLGLAYKKIQLKSDQVAGGTGRKRDAASVKRVVQ